MNVEVSDVAKAVPGDAVGNVTSPIRELTARAIVLGITLAVVLGAANAYLGLFAGMTISASIPAAVVSMAILRGLGGATLLENNVVQAIASAGEAMAAGAIFTFPALVILGNRSALSYRNVTMLCLAGGTIGSLLIVFLRRAYIEEERLPYPEGLACAEVLRAGAAHANARPLVAGGVIAGLTKASQSIAGLLPDSIGMARRVGGVTLAGSFDLSAALLGVGYLIGIKIAVLVFSGGIIAWGIAIPLISHSNDAWRAMDPGMAAAQIWSSQARYLGVGAMLVGGVATLWRLRARMGAAIGAGFRSIRAGRIAAVAVSREQLDLAPSTVTIAIALCLPAVFFVILTLSGSFWLSAVMAVALLVIGFFATAIAGYLTGLVGASNNPVSGVTIIVVLGVAGLLILLGVDAGSGPTLTILAGSVVCTAAAMAGDSLHDLATGFHLGATPRALEIAVLIGAIASAFVMAPILNLLIDGYGIAGTSSARAGALAAPQAFLMANVARGTFSGGLPWRAIWAGALLAMGLEITDRVLERRASGWRTPTMPMAIGLYLPLGLSAAIFAGAVGRAFFSRDSRDLGDDNAGTLFAAGLVAGEALMGVIGGALVTIGLRTPLW